MIDGNMEKEDRPSRMDMWKHRVHAAIYPPRETEIPGFVRFLRAFVMLLIIASVFIVLVMACDPPPSVRETCRKLEIWIAGIFAFEYLLRLWTADLEFPVKRDEGMASAPRPLRNLYACWMILKPRLMYVFSGLAIVDLLAILSPFLSYSKQSSLLGIRALRLFRLIWICKVTQYSATLSLITDVIKEKAKELLSVLVFMLLILAFLTLLMYSAEHEAQPDVAAMPVAWWCVETFTKSGAHGFCPVTSFGRIIGILISVLGICLFAIFTGIILAGMKDRFKKGEESGEAVPAESPPTGVAHDKQ